jgi:hypothetical protein
MEAIIKKTLCLGTGFYAATRAEIVFFSRFERPVENLFFRVLRCHWHITSPPFTKWRLQPFNQRQPLVLLQLVFLFQDP